MDMDSSLQQPPVFTLKDAGFQVIAALVAHSLAIHAGINMAFSTILLPQIMISNPITGNFSVEQTAKYTTNLETLNAGGDGLLVDKDQATWIASLVTITTPVGSLVSGPLMDRFGRKTVCFMTTLPLIAAWTTAAAVTTQVYLLYTSRALAGFGAGLSTVGLVYVSEISHASVRPMLLSLNSAFVSFGILITTLLGHIMPWEGVALSSAILAFTSFVVIFTIPESPVWLSSIRRCDNTNKNDRVLRSLRWLYRKPEAYDLIRSRLTTNIMHKNTKDIPSPESLVITQAELRKKETKETKRKSNTWKPVFLLLGLFFLQQFSGGYVVIFYAIQIFQAAGAMRLDEWTSLILLGVIRFVMAIASAFLSRTVGRRKLLMSSGIGMGTAMFLASASLFIKSSPAFLQAICVLAFVCFSSFGFLVIPWTLIGELLPNSIRGKGSGFIISFAYLLMFSTVKMFVYVLDLIGLGFMFLFFAVLSIMAVTYVYFFIPETLGKTFEEIEKNF